jgi:formamidopyrimidine-DNA glycosylase
MPELPEVETVRKELNTFVKGLKIMNVSSPSGKTLRKPVNWGKTSFKILSVSRWGKRLFIDLEKDTHLDVSLGMTGFFRFKDSKSKSFKTHDHLCLELSNKKKLIYNDTRRFGWIEFKSSLPLIKGWDPVLSSDEEKRELVEVIKKSRKDLFSFLMDQKYIVGLGNIYVQEALFRAGLNPFKKSYKTSKKKLYLLLDEVQSVVFEALKFKGTTIINYRSASGEEGGFQSRLKVYGKSSKNQCVVCAHPLIKIKKARSVTYCSQCQK